MSAFVCSENHFNYILSCVHSTALKKRHDANLYVDSNLTTRSLGDSVSFSELNQLTSSNYFVFNLKNKDHLNLIFKILVSENIHSVNSRYNDKEKYIEFRFCPTLKTNIPQANELLRSLNYQSCESDDYDNSLAKALIKDLRLFLLEYFVETNNKENKLDWAIS